MNKREREQHWDTTLHRLQQEQDPSTQDGFLTDQALSQRQIERNFNRDQGLAAVEKARASAIVDKWKGAEVQEAVKRTKQKIYQVFRNQELRSRYPDLFPKPNKPA
jgi:hypothetical protein